jgi:predicted N-acetyltransferase YhbS
MRDTTGTSPASLSLRAADPRDAAAREAVREITRAAFLIDPVTQRRIEGDTPPELPMVDAFFAQDAADHLHVAEEGGRIAAYVLYSRGALDSDPDLRAEGLTIMGVLPARQRQGIGTALLAWSVQRLRGAYDLLFVLGHPDFYARAGFVEAESLGLRFTYEAPKEACRVLLRDGLRVEPGVVSYHPIVSEFC